MPKPGQGTLTLLPDLLVAEADEYRRDIAGQRTLWSTVAGGVLWSQALGGLGLIIHEAPWLRVVDRRGQLLPSLPEEAAARQSTDARAEREAERARRLTAG